MNTTAIVLAGLMAAGSVTAAQAGIVTNVLDPFPPGSGFTSPGGCFPGVNVCSTNLKSSNFSYVSPPVFDGVGEHAQLTALFTGTLTDPTMTPLPGGNFAVQGTLDVTIFGRFPNTVGSWSAQIDDEHVHVDIPGHSLDLMLLAPAPGQVSIQSLSPGDNFPPPYLVDSFFDVFAQITVDGTPFAAPFEIQQGDVGTVVEPASLAALGLPLGLLGARRRRPLPA